MWILYHLKCWLFSIWYTPHLHHLHVPLYEVLAASGRLCQHHKPDINILYVRVRKLRLLFLCYIIRFDEHENFTKVKWSIMSLLVSVISCWTFILHILSLSNTCTINKYVSLWVKCCYFHIVRYRYSGQCFFAGFLSLKCDNLTGIFWSS